MWRMALSVHPTFYGIATNWVNFWDDWYKSYILNICTKIIYQDHICIRMLLFLRRVRCLVHMIVFCMMFILVTIVALPLNLFESLYLKFSPTYLCFLSRSFLDYFTILTSETKYGLPVFFLEFKMVPFLIIAALGITHC